MAGKIQSLLKLGATASLDVVAGSSIAFFITSLYDPMPEQLTYMQLLSRVVTRTFFTAFLGDEIREFLYPFDFEDPTGGFFFAIAMLSQPQLFLEAKLLVGKTLEMTLQSPLFNMLPTLGTEKRNSNDSNVNSPVDAKVGNALNNTVTQIRNGIVPK
jgi:hypothetical protein